MCGGRGTRLEADAEKPLVRVGGAPMVDRVVDALGAVPATGKGVDLPGVGADPPGVETDPIGVDRTYAAVSPHAPATGDHLGDRGDVTVVETPGEGYVEDLGVALDAIPGDGAVLTAVADLPLFAPESVEAVLRAWYRAGGDGDREGSHSLTVRVPLALKSRLGASVDDRVVFEDGNDAYLPAGINVVGRGGGSGDDSNDDEPSDDSNDEEPSDDSNDDEPNDDSNDDEPSDDEVTETVYTTYDARLAVNVNRPSDRTVAEALLCD